MSTRQRQLAELLVNGPPKRKMTFRKFLRRYNRQLLVLGIILLGVLFLWAAWYSGGYYLHGVWYEN